jgi:hypothetical protein
VALVGMVVGNVVVAFTIFVEWHVLKISLSNVIGAIFFLLALIMQTFSTIKAYKMLTSTTWTFLSTFGCVMINFGDIGLSIVATIPNWPTNKFDIRTLMVIPNLPFTRLK